MNRFWLDKNIYFPSLANRRRINFTLRRIFLAFSLDQCPITDYLVRTSRSTSAILSGCVQDFDYESCIVCSIR